MTIYVKRIFDFLASFILLIVLMPVFILLALKVKKEVGSPVIFKQSRPGLDEKIFSLLKFRTMNQDLDSDGRLLEDHLRLSDFGSRLRSTSLDELPSLWNVLKGDMSIVGPRPLLVDYLPLYNERQSIRHNVRPGITGWAQINGRNAISWEHKFELDVWYVENQSFWLDIKILALTVKKVFLKEDISADGHVTTEPFTGSQNQESGQS